MCYICRYTAYTTGNEWTLSQRGADATHFTHGTCRSWTPKFSRLAGGALPTPTRHSGVLPAHSSLHSSPSFFLFLFFPLRRRHPPPSPRKWLVVNSSSQGTRLTHKTFKRRFCLSCSLARERTRPITQSVGDPPRTAHPTTTILSAHAHGKGLGTTRKMGPVARPGPPKHHTPRVLCRFWHDVSALARPSQWVLEATG